jgi:predicted nucleotidyltransferase
MDFRHPFAVVTPTLDGDVLRVLAGVDTELTGAQVHRLVGHSSVAGVRRVLIRLSEQGIVDVRGAGAAKLYRFNREHVAALWVQGLAGVRNQLVDRLRARIADWDIQPVVAALFGSAARGEATPRSDLDIFLVRPSGADEEVWVDQTAALAGAATRWTGNEARTLEMSEDELADAADEPVVSDILEHGIELAGSLRRLRRLARS